jgi:hypothetical protein
MKANRKIMANQVVKEFKNEICVTLRITTRLQITGLGGDIANLPK